MSVRAYNLTNQKFSFKFCSRILLTQNNKNPVFLRFSFLFLESRAKYEKKNDHQSRIVNYGIICKQSSFWRATYCFLFWWYHLNLRTPLDSLFYLFKREELKRKSSCQTLFIGWLSFLIIIIRKTPRLAPCPLVFLIPDRMDLVGEDFWFLFLKFWWYPETECTFLDSSIFSKGMRRTVSFSIQTFHSDLFLVWIIFCFVFAYDDPFEKSFRFLIELL